MKDSPKISTLFPDLFLYPRPVISGTNPLVINASLLIFEEVPMLPMVGGSESPPVIDPETKLKKYMAVGGHPVLEAIMRAEPRDYQKLLWGTQSREIPVWIGSVRFKDSTLDDVLEIYEKTRSGDVVVEGENNTLALLTLKEIASLLEAQRLVVSDLRVTDVGTEKVSVSSDVFIKDALKVMFSRRIRRVFVSGLQSNDQLHFISSRDIIRFLFTSQRLELCKESPDLWLEERISNVPSTIARFVSDYGTLAHASRVIGKRTADCVVCKESDKVVSRWDLVMKPWKIGKLEVKGDWRSDLV